MFHLHKVHYQTKKKSTVQWNVTKQHNKSTLTTACISAQCIVVRLVLSSNSCFNLPGFNFLNTTVNHCLVCSLFRLSPSTCMLTVDRSKLKLIIFIELSSPAWTARKKGMKKSYSCRTTRYSFTSHIFYLLLCVCEREGVVYHCFSYLSYCLKLELPEINR